MDKSVRRQLKLAVSIVVFLSYAALNTTYDYTASIMLIPFIMIGFMPIGEWLETRTPLYKTVSTGIAMFAVLYLMMAFVSRGLLEAVTGLFIFIQGYSMVHLKEEKNYHHILLMSFFILLAAIVLSPTATLGLVLILFLISSAWALFLLEIALASSRATRYRVDESIQLKTSHKKIKEGRLVDIRVAMWVSAFTIILVFGTGAIFVLVPRTEAGFLGASQQWDTFTTGESQEIDLSVSGILENDTTAIMEVTFTHNETGRFEREMYWRVSTLDNYDGKKWTRNGLITHRNVAGPGFQFLHSLGARRLTDIGVSRNSFSRGELVTYELFIDKIPEGGVPALDLVRAVTPHDKKQLIDLNWNLSGDFSVNLKSKTDSGVRLIASSEYFKPGRQELLDASEDYLEVMLPSDLRLLRSETLTPETIRLVEDIVEGATSVPEKMERLNNYFNGNDFFYTRQVPKLGDEHPIDTFLLDVKSGHCQLYASALALMARKAGIPARLAKGFRGGTWNSRDKTYTVSNDMAHVWVEVFYPGVGWVVYDPSPAEAEISLLSINGIMRYASNLALKAKIAWLRDVIGYTQENRFSIMKDKVFRIFNSFESDPEENAKPEGESLITKYGGAFKGLALLAWFGSLIFFVVRLWHRWRRLNVYKLTEDQDRARQFYRKLVGKLERLGIVCKGKSAEEISRASRTLDVPINGDIGGLIDRYQMVRFGQTPLSPKEFRVLLKQLNDVHLVRSS